jgi:cellulose synthase/poly-beta-1,6-N-acetylglucosamine synthase-like glycosyltransferase
VQILLSTHLNHLQISNRKHWQKREDFCIKKPRYSRLSLLAEIFKCCSRFSSFSQLFSFFSFSSVLQSYFLVLCSCRILFTVVLPFCFSVKFSSFFLFRSGFLFLFSKFILSVIPFLLYSFWTKTTLLFPVELRPISWT